MLKQLLIGFAVMIGTVAVQAEMFSMMTRRHERVLAHSKRLFGHFSVTAYLSVVMLLIMATMTIQIVIWALALMATGAVEGLEPSVYFALLCFTTLGFGDVNVQLEWRLLSALIGANGFLMFGWSTAFMTEKIRKLR